MLRNLLTGAALVAAVLVASVAPSPVLAGRSDGERFELGGMDPATADQVNAALAHYALAVRTLPPDSIAACYATGGQLLLPGLAPISGRVAIHDFLVPMVAGSAVDSTTMSSELLGGNAALASQWGTYRQVAGPKGGAHGLYTGRFSAMWIYNTSEGRWLIARLMMQPLPTPTTPAAAPAPGSSSAAPTPGK